MVWMATNTTIHLTVQDTVENITLYTKRIGILEELKNNEKNLNKVYSFLPVPYA